MPMSQEESQSVAVCGHCHSGCRKPRLQGPGGGGEVGERLKEADSEKLTHRPAQRQVDAY